MSAERERLYVEQLAPLLLLATAGAVDQGTPELWQRAIAVAEWATRRMKLERAQIAARTLIADHGWPAVEAVVQAAH